MILGGRRGVRRGVGAGGGRYMWWMGWMVFVVRSEGKYCVNELMHYHNGE